MDREVQLMQLNHCDGVLSNCWYFFIRAIKLSSQWCLKAVANRTTCWQTGNLNSNVFLRFKCRNRRISNVFFLANEWKFTHVSQTKKLSKQSDLLANMLSGLRQPLMTRSAYYTGNAQYTIIMIYVHTTRQCLSI